MPFNAQRLARAAAPCYNIGEMEVRRMDYTNAMMVWDAVSVRIADVCHGTIAGEQMELTSENALLLFVLGKDARVTVEDTLYAPRGETLFHIGRGRHVRMSAAGPPTPWHGSICVRIFRKTFLSCDWPGFWASAVPLCTNSLPGAWA